MALKGVHFLLTYQCTLECEHCFVWGSPNQSGTMSLDAIRTILRQAKDAGVRSVHFEGGEPFLYYVLMVEGVRMARRMGLGAGIVTNGYWATTVEDAIAWLRPFEGELGGLSVSSDLYHWTEKQAVLARNAEAAAKKLGIPVGYISIAKPAAKGARGAFGQLPEGESSVMYRGRAAATLAAKAPKRPWSSFLTCPYENLREPDRVHVDPLGYVHVCNGIAAGNLFERPLKEILAAYDPGADPIVGPLIAGGPAELVRRHKVRHAAKYADACHLCYEARTKLRKRYPRILAPDQSYGVVSGM